MSTNRSFKRVVLLLLLLSIGAIAAPVITWIPPYGTKPCIENLSKDYDGYGPKDGISHLALQFWEPDGSGGIRYASKDG